MIERDLQYNDGSEISVVTVRFSDPQSADIDWTCTCTIAGKSVSKALTQYGVDSFQSFILTAKVADAWLRALPAYKSGQLYFQEPHDDILLHP